MNKIIIISFLAICTLNSNAQLIKKLKEQFKTELDSGVSKKSEVKITEKSAKASTAIVNAPEKVVNKILDKLKKKKKKPVVETATAPPPPPPPVIDTLQNK